MLLLGSKTLVGQAFAAELRLRGTSFISLDLDQVNFADFDVLFHWVRKIKPALVINAAGVREGPDRQLSQAEKAHVLCSNVLVPQAVARVCKMRNLAWGHVSSGTIFRGAKVFQGGKWLVEIDLQRLEFRRLMRQDPSRVRGFTEADEPNHCFVCPPCDFHSGAMALGEQAIKDCDQHYIWRPGLFVLEQHHPENLITKLGRPAPRAKNRLGRLKNCIVESEGQYVSVTHLGEFVSTCLDLWESRASYGIYHIVNKGLVNTRDLASQISSAEGRVVPCDENFGSVPQERFLLDGTKLSSLGHRMRPVESSLQECIGALCHRHAIWDEPSAGSLLCSKDSSNRVKSGNV